MARKATVDPVEAAKIHATKPSSKPAPASPPAHAYPASPPPSPAPAQPPAPATAFPTPLDRPAAAPATPAAPAPEAAPAPKQPIRARVKAEKLVSIRGQIIRLKVGQEVSDECHGPGAVARLIQSGIELDVLD